MDPKQKQESLDESEAAALEIISGRGDDDGEGGESKLPIPEDKPAEDGHEAGAEDVNTDDNDEQSKPGEEDEGKSEESEAGDEDQDDIVSQAVDDLGNVLGKKLTDEEAIPALAESHLNASRKIKLLSSSLKEASDYRERYEQLMANPYVKALAEGKNPFPDPAEADDYDGELTPEVKKLIDSQKVELIKLSEEIQRINKGNIEARNDNFQKQVDTIRNNIIDFAKKPENSDFAKIYKEYNDIKKIDPYASLPPVLSKLVKMLDEGIDVATAWSALNPDRLIARVKSQAMKGQKGKLHNRNPIRRRTKGVAPLRDLSMTDSTEDLIAGALHNARVKAGAT